MLGNRAAHPNHFVVRMCSYNKNVLSFSTHSDLCSPASRAWIGSVQGAVATWSNRMLITDQVATAPCTDPIQGCVAYQIAAGHCTAVKKQIQHRQVWREFTTVREE